MEPTTKWFTDTRKVIVGGSLKALEAHCPSILVSALVLRKINFRIVTLACEKNSQMLLRISTIIRFKNCTKLKFFFISRVVTGVRFTKKNRVLHLQIQQATVGPEGNITDIPSWKDVEEVTDAELLDNDRGVVKKKVFKIGYKKNTILLDDVLIDPGYVVTGLRFTRHKNNLCLEVHQTTFDYTSGKLNAKPDWMSWVRNHCIVPMSER